jgi:hypothetical protein
LSIEISTSVDTRAIANQRAMPITKLCGLGRNPLRSHAIATDASSGRTTTPTRMTRATHGRAVHIAGRMVSLIVPSAGRERV